MTINLRAQRLNLQVSKVSDVLLQIIFSIFLSDLIVRELALQHVYHNANTNFPAGTTAVFAIAIIAIAGKGAGLRSTLAVPSTHLTTRAGAHWGWGGPDRSTLALLSTHLTRRAGAHWGWGGSDRRWGGPDRSWGGPDRSWGGLYRRDRDTNSVAPTHLAGGAGAYHR